MGMRNGLSACSSWRWQIAAPTIPWDSFCGLLKLGSTFTTRSDRTRDSIIFLRSNMLNNMLCRIFLYLPFSSVYFTGYLTRATDRAVYYPSCPGRYAVSLQHNWYGD